MVVTENTLLYRDLTEREATLAPDGGRAKLALEDVGGGALDRRVGGRFLRLDLN